MDKDSKKKQILIELSDLEYERAKNILKNLGITHKYIYLSGLLYLEKKMSGKDENKLFEKLNEIYEKIIKIDKKEGEKILNILKEDLKKLYEDIKEIEKDFKSLLIRKELKKIERDINSLFKKLEITEEKKENKKIKMKIDDNNN